MEKLKVKIVNKSNNALPEYKTSGSAGMDLRANLGETLVLMPFTPTLCPTGLYLAIPEGYEGQVRPRSGLSLKGITVCNTPGTIDADYRGEVKVILINLSNVPFEVNNGDRIAQLVFAKCEQAELLKVNELDKTERGEGGFGHSGIK